MDEATLERYADLIVGFGANVQPDQIVAVGAELGHAALARAVAASAYRRGARFVDVAYFDPHVKRARIEHAREETLDFVPNWYGQRVLALGEQQCARIGLTGPTEPGLFDGLDPTRIGRDQLPFLRESGKVINDRTTNWTASPCPTQPWAELVHPGLGPAAALARLEEQLAHVCRLDEDDPIAAWDERMATVGAASDRLMARRFSALRFEGPGTDLMVGLYPSQRWTMARFETVWGLRHMPNLPSEETFTTPDPTRVDGIARITKPLVLPGGVIVRGLELRFEGGRAVSIEAQTGADVVRSMCSRDDGASRLGEVALVDGDGRIGQLGTVFFDTLIDENAASHVALGQSYGFALDDHRDRETANRSAIHVDVMIGGEGVVVSGLTDSGEEVPVLRDGAWLI